MTLQITAMSESEATRIAVPDSDAGLGALRTDRGNLPLDRIDVTAEIVGLVSTVTLTQEFVNVHSEPLAATYVFPLPERAAVTGMRMTAADRVVEATLRERGEARRAYDDAVAAGQRAAIAEEERPDVFTMRVGNIVAGERVTITMTLAGALPVEDGTATFRFPLVVAPRYIPGAPLPGGNVGDGHAGDTDAVPDASRITPPVLLPGFPNPVRLGIDVGIDPAGLPLGEVRSSLYAVTESDGRISIRPGERANRDFVLRLAYGAPERAAAVALTSDETGDEGTFQLTVLPPDGAGPARPRDVVLLLDRSGSMEGWKMVAARRAAARIVDTLVGADRFAVLAFDHQVETPQGLPDGLVAATDRNRYRAVEHLAKMTARGGTELLDPLRRGLALLADSGRDRVLVLVTDGQVGNEDQILRESGAGLDGGVRVHAVGIDQAVNAGFLGRLASVGGGRCELVESEDRLDEAMASIHRRIGSPLVTGVRLAADGLRDAGLEEVEGTRTPERLPDVFPGVPYVVRGRYRRRPDAETGATAVAGAVTVSGTTRDGAAWSVTADAERCEAPALRAVWARAALRDLEDRYAMSSLSPEASQRAALERRIVETSLRFGVLCRFTAYVAVDTRKVAQPGQPRTVVQPVEYPAGWEDPTSAGLPAPMMAAPMAFGVGAPAPLGPPPGPTGIAVGGAGGGLAGRAVRRAASASGVAGKISQAVFRGAGGGRSEAGPADPAGVRSWAETEAGRLREAEGEPAYRRRELLEDLASRLAALTRDDTAASRTLEPLAELLGGDRIGRRPLDELWREVLRVLDDVAGGGARSPGGAVRRPADGDRDDPGSGPEPGRRSGRFWT